MILKVFVQDVAYSDAVIAESVSISKDISDRSSTAEMVFKMQGGTTVARYDEGSAVYDTATYGVDVRELYDIRVEDSFGVRQFAGKIVRLEFERKTANLTLVKVACQDYTSLFDQFTIPEATFVGQTDRTILQTLIGTYTPSITSLNANVEQLETIGLFEIKGETVRSAIDRIAALTGAEWRVDYNGNFKYFTPTAYPAPFGLTSQPNTPGALNQQLTWNNATQTWEQAEFPWEAGGGPANMTWDQATQTWDESGGATWDSGLTFLVTYAIDAFTGYTRDAVTIINSCRVLGGFLPGGVEIDISYEDPISVLEYGRRKHTIVDRDISTSIDAMLRAKAVVNEHAFPEESFTLSTKHDGLDVGQLLPIYHPDYFINGAYIIRSIRINQESHSITNYALDLGVKPPDELRLLRQLEARSRRSSQTPQAIPVDGSVGTSSISGSGLNASVLVGVITAGGDVDIDAGSIFGTISGDDVTVDASVIAGTISGNTVTVDAGTIQGVITGNDVAVDVTTFQGAIISSQVADDLIDRLSLFNSALRPIPEFATDPALPSPNHPVGSAYRNTSNGQFYVNVANAWTLSNEATAINGKVTFYHVGTIKAGSIIGLIAAAQIGSITAGQISGQIQASQIAAVNASAIAGSITASQIGTVNASAIQGSIVSSQIASVSATTITGTITSTQIGSINAATITIGLIGNSQINSVSASKLTAGTIDASVITVTNLNATNITSGTMSANRIGAGTISASISLTAPDLQITSGGTVVDIDAGNYVRLTTSGTSTVVAAEPGGFSVRDIVGFARSDMGKGQITFVSAGGVSGSLGPSALILGGNQVVGTRHTGWGTPTGGVSRASYNAGTVLLGQLAQFVAALYTDLASHGLLG